MENSELRSPHFDLLLLLRTSRQGVLSRVLKVREGSWCSSAKENNGDLPPPFATERTPASGSLSLDSECGVWAVMIPRAALRHYTA